MREFFLVIILLSISYVSFCQTKVPEQGKKVYDQYCLACHQADGAGVPNMNPPIGKSDWVNGDKTELINVILKGLNGDEIQVNGEYFGGVMASHAFLTDTQVADVLTYIRSNFGNNSDKITPEEVKKLRKP